MRANLKSIMLMVIAMGCLTLTDMLIKIASQTLPIGQVMIFYGVGALAVVCTLLAVTARGMVAPQTPAHR